MSVIGSNLNFINPNEKKVIALMMGNEEVIDIGEEDNIEVIDIEEGEISDDDNQSNEVINGGDEELKEKEVKESKPREESRVWTMEDLMKYHHYPGVNNYTTNLYKLAWAHGIQNKPVVHLNEITVGSNVLAVDDDNKIKMLDVSTEEEIKSLKDVIIRNVVVDSKMKMIDDSDEKEEGELEEGEIELDGGEMDEETEEKSSAYNSVSNGGSNREKSMNEEVQKQINSIRQALETTITAKNGEKHFDGICSELRTSFDSLQKIVLENGISPVDDTLIRQSFAAIRAVNSVFCSMNPNQQEHNKDVFSRLLAYVKSQSFTLFSPEQMKEVESMVCSLESRSSVKTMDNDKEIQEKNGVNRNGSGIVSENPVRDLNSSKKFNLEPLIVKYTDQSTAKVGPTGIMSSIPFSGFKGRGGYGPLLDLHMDHDVDDLPSPTREAPKPFLIQKQQVGHWNHDVGNLPSPTRETPTPLLIQKPQVVHWNHGMDSLPSPTRETPTPFPVQKLHIAHRDRNPGSLPLLPKWETPTLMPAQKQQVVSSDEPIKSEFVSAKTENRNEVHPYETDAHKAVSTYQQKFGRTSFSVNTQLPSPTPSEESNDGDDDSKEEVSSSIVANGATVNPFIPLQTVSSATFQKDGSSRHGNLPAKTAEQLDYGIKPTVLKPQPKSRDPRLRFLNSEVGSSVDLNERSPYVEYNAPRNESMEGIISSRKNKIVPDSVLDGHTLKRQRNGLTSSTGFEGVQMSTGSGGWLDDISTVRPQPTSRGQLAERVGSDPRKFGNGEVFSGLRQDNTKIGNFNLRAGGNDQLPLTGPDNTMGSLPSLLKDIAVNPTMLINLIREQQRLASGTQQKSGTLTQNKMIGSSSNIIPVSAPSANITSSKSSEVEHKPSIKLQGSAQTNATGEFGNIRMKPRDPRRILQNSSALQKNDCPGAEQSKTSGAPSPLIQPNKDNLIVRQHGEQLAQTNPVPSHSASAPDIAQQFTKELKNLADILSTSQATNSPSVVPQTVSSQSIPTKVDTTEMSTVVTETKDQQSGTGTTPEEEGKVGPSENKWEDVEHLFDGYDDQQRAAIHRERARRIDEQNKMFAARKLCLVLDLDHTLLNSAKFIEVDPVHEKILRKKEEQDREKQQRHLFRFPHMGMWTKLRPGVWNFLEKASKLFEMHLYTMGNKRYATEMAKVLDPTGALFAGRVISKGDEADPFDGDERVPKSKDLEGVLGMESAVVIIDDSVRVWPHNKLNLIVVERYTYFPCSRRQFGLPGPSLLEIDHDERPEEGTLASSLAVIERIHQSFFSHKALHDVDVRNILAAEQRKILSGCRIVFSRIFPVGETNPQLHPLWQSAEQFGAVCTTQIDEQVTHVVANSLGTDKVNWALSTGRFVVYPSWVEASTLLFRRASEHDFAVKI